MIAGDKVLGRCTLTEIRKEDGAQKYEYDSGSIEWLMGWNRASNPRVGDTGTMVYVIGPNYGLPFFRRDS